MGWLLNNFLMVYFMTVQEKDIQAFNDVLGFYGPLLTADAEYMALYGYWLNVLAVRAD